MTYQEVKNFLNERIILDIQQNISIYLATRNMTKTFYEMNAKKWESFESLKITIIELLFAEALKYLFYKQKLGIINVEERTLLEILLQFNSFEGLKEEVLVNDKLLHQLFYTFIEAESLKSSVKIMIGKSLIPLEKQAILKIVPKYQSEFCEKEEHVTLHLLLNEVLAESNAYLNSFNLSIVSLFNFLHQMCIYDQENGLSLLIELADLYYNILKYLEENGFRRDGMQEYFYAFEEMPESHLASSILNNEELLYSILWIVVKILIEQNYEGINVTLIEIQKRNYKKNNRRKKGKDKE